AVFGLVAAGLVATGGAFQAADDRKADAAHAGHFEACAKACTMCMRECEMCAHHCAHMIAEGKKEHLRTLGTCADCAEFCASAARIVSRHGPMATTICESCARACDVCGETCEKYPEDEHMKRCAKACRECARACREMVKHAGHEDRK